MSDNSIRWTQDTKASTSKTSPEEVTKKAVLSDEDFSKFLTKIAVAKVKKEQIVEVSQAVIDRYNDPSTGGLRDAKYFIFEGIMVCLNGDASEVLASLGESLDQRMHGPQEGVVEGRT